MGAVNDIPVLTRVDSSTQAKAMLTHAEDPARAEAQVELDALYREFHRRMAGGSAGPMEVPAVESLSPRRKEFPRYAPDGQRLVDDSQPDRQRLADDSQDFLEGELNFRQPGPSTQSLPPEALTVKL